MKKYTIGAGFLDGSAICREEGRGREEQAGAQNEQSRNSFERIYEIVRRIPRGKVATYGQIALLAGNPRWSRVVGFALHVNPDPDGIPCFRVVNRFGQVSEAFAFGGGNRQIELLEAEGVPCPDGRVDLIKYQWKPGLED